MSDFIDNLKSHLNEGRVTVDFIKVDGSYRTMLCTKNFAEIPSEDIPKGQVKKPNDSIIRVYDLEKNAWRSIKIDNIQAWVKS